MRGLKCHVCNGEGGGKAPDGQGWYTDEMCPQCEGKGYFTWIQSIKYWFLTKYYDLKYRFSTKG